VTTGEAATNRDEAQGSGSKGQSAKKADKKEESDSGGNQLFRLLLLGMAGLVLAFIALVFLAFHSDSPGERVSLDRVYTLAGRNQLQSVTLRDEDALIVGKYCLAPGPPPPQGAQALGEDLPPAVAGALASVTARPDTCEDVTKAFHASYPASDAATQQLIEVIRTVSGADVTVDDQNGTAVAKLLATFVLPLLMLANLFGLIFVAGDKSLSDIAGFSRLGGKGQSGTDGSPQVTFADVAGADEAVTELREVIDYLSDPQRFQSYGAAPPKGVMLFGSPGCGKTLLARATAGETGVPFFSVSGTEFVESLVGVGAARIRDLFAQIRAAAPAIVFVDEIDAVGRRRSGEGGSGGEREQTLNQLLVELDGFEVTSGIVMMGATNRPDILDPALMRPGRFDRHITLTAPDLPGRQAILELNARSRPLADDVDLTVLAKRTPGFTGADLANVINEAALLAIREGPGTPISTTHLSESVYRVLHGPQRRGQLLSPEESRRLAYHEAGHALVAATLGANEEGQRVSIVARGGGLGQTGGFDTGDQALQTASDMRAQLVMAMAGTAAETLALGETSSTVEDDLRRANALAREMVGRYGMSAEVGWLHLLSTTDGYLGGDAEFEQMSAHTMTLLDAEVRNLTTAAEREANARLDTHRAHLDEMVAALQEHETLEGEALERFLEPVRASHDGGDKVGVLDNAATQPQGETTHGEQKAAKSAGGVKRTSQ
jgi:cell division protease FtsH